jgi:RNA ligase
MNNYVHSARLMDYDELVAGLNEAIDAGMVFVRHSGDLSIYCYTPNCVYDRNWTPITLLARGLVLDTVKKQVAATPFPKFFNIGERDSIPDLPFETMDKLDGSLIIIFYHNGVWYCATKGSLDSEQAKAAASWLSKQNTLYLYPGDTYLAEYVGPNNRIVIPYHKEELILLAAYNRSGEEIPYDDLENIATCLGWNITTRRQFDSLQDLVTHTSNLSHEEEGFVIRFSNGLRLKIKGDEYRRIHALISRCTPLAMWEAMLAGDNLTDIRRQLPEEFWVDFDMIIDILESRISGIVDMVKQEADKVAHLSDKEVGLKLNQYPDDIRSFIFPYRKNDGNLLVGKARIGLFRYVRPTANVLVGYVPSYAMNRIIEEDS